MVSSSTDEKFLLKYLTLTRADLYFADKAILVEGASERVFVPAAEEKLAARKPDTALLHQYVTLMEVGGAYAPDGRLAVICPGQAPIFCV